VIVSYFLTNSNYYDLIPIMDRLKKLFKSNKLKFTPQRIAIYQLLKNRKDHPSTDALYRQLKKSYSSISFDTVHRTLLSFAQIGLIHVVEGNGDVKRFDPDTTDHHHVRCLQCGTIVDFHNKSYDGIHVPPEINKIFHVTSKKVVLEGYCNQCKRIVKPEKEHAKWKKRENVR